MNERAPFRAALLAYSVSGAESCVRGGERGARFDEKRSWQKSSWAGGSKMRQKNRALGLPERKRVKKNSSPPME